jgi:hypothetical protein
MSSRLQLVTIAVLAAAVAQVLALSTVTSEASAAMRSFPATSVAASGARFEPRGIDPDSVQRARFLVAGKSHDLNSESLRDDLRDGRVRLPLPHGERGVARQALRLRIWTRAESSDPQPAPFASGTTIRSHGPAKEAPTTSAPKAPGKPAEPPRKPETTPPTSPAPNPGSEISIPANARYVSATAGSDSNPGTEGAPWRTAAKAAASAAPGDVVVFLPGTYGAPGTTTDFGRSGTTAAPITFTSAPGAGRAVFRGYVRITGSHLHFDSLVFDGPTGRVQSTSSSNPGGEEVQLSIMYGSDVELSNSEVRDNAWHAGVFVDQASDVRLVSNYVHDNGEVSTGANLDHGIYWCSGDGEITNNVIENNVAYGIQLYPEATGVLVSHNTIVGNDRGGVIIAEQAADNQLLDNVIAENAQYGIRGYELTGTGNVARNNLLWNNGHNVYGSGVAVSGTIVQDPKLVTISNVKASGRGRVQGTKSDPGAYGVR